MSRASQSLSIGRDLVIGFNALAGLDVLYCADASYVGRKRGLLSRIRPRYRILHKLEAACFSPGSRTRIWLLDGRQREEYLRVWNSEPERLKIVQGSVPADRVNPSLRFSSLRGEIRRSLGASELDTIWLHISVYPFIKGLDLVIDALPAFPDARLVAVGPSADKKQGRKLAERARKLGCSDRVHFLGYRDDIPQLMAAADLLVYPSRNDVTGTVILEALCNALPAIVSSNCGYAGYVAAAGSGRVLANVADAAELQAAIASAGTNERRQWSNNALRYAETLDATAGLQQVAKEMLCLGERPRVDRDAGLA